jgi:Tfp pilus assembly protein PilF
MHRNPKLRWLVPLLVVSAVIGIATSFAVPDEGEESLSAEETAALERYAARFERAQQLMGGGKDAEAAKMFRELLAERDDVGQVHHALAFVLRYQGKADEATRSFLRAAQLAPDDAVIARDAGLDLLERGFLTDSRTLLERSLKQDTNDLETGVGLGSALRRLGERDAAVAAFELAVKVDPNSLDAHVGLAQSLVTQDPKRALSIVEPLNHNFADVSLVHGLALERQGAHDLARPLLLSAATTCTSNAAGREVLLEASEGLVRCGDAEDAATAAALWCQAESTATEGPGVRASFALATARAALDDAEGALSVLDAARAGGESLGIRMHTGLFAAVLLRRLGRASDA